MRTKLTALFLVVILGGPGLIGAGFGFAQTEFPLEVREGTLFKIPIEVHQWVYEGLDRRVMPIGEAPEDLLVQDLTFSGFFEIRREAGVSWAATSTGSTRPAEAIVQGIVRPSRGTAELTGSLVDPTSGKADLPEDVRARRPAAPLGGARVRRRHRPLPHRRARRRRRRRSPSSATPPATRRSTSSTTTARRWR